MRDLDTRLDEVDADIKLHQQVVQLKSYSSDCVGSFKSGDYSNATTKCVLFSKLFRSSTQESEDQRAKVVQMVGPQAVALQEKTKASLVELLLKDYNAGIEAANLQEICRVVPLLGDLDLATEAVGLYLKFVKKVLVDALNEATQSSDDSTSTKIAQVRTEEPKFECRLYHGFFSPLLYTHIPPFTSLVADFQRRRHCTSPPPSHGFAGAGSGRGRQGAFAARPP